MLRAQCELLTSRDSFKLILNFDISGTLNLQNREMTVIPDDVYRLNDPELLKSLVGDSEDLKWWETEPIAKLYLCSNKITYDMHIIFYTVYSTFMKP